MHQPLCVTASNPPDPEERELSESKCKGLMEAEGDGYLGSARQGESCSFKQLIIWDAYAAHFQGVVFLTTFQLEIVGPAQASSFFLPPPQLTLQCR